MTLASICVTDRLIICCNETTTVYIYIYGVVFEPSKNIRTSTPAYILVGNVEA